MMYVSFGTYATIQHFADNYDVMLCGMLAVEGLRVEFHCYPIVKYSLKWTKPERGRTLTRCTACIRVEALRSISNKWQLKAVKKFSAKRLARCPWPKAKRFSS